MPITEQQFISAGNDDKKIDIIRSGINEHININCKDVR